MFSDSTFRTSHPELFGKKVVIKDFAIFTGKHLCWSLQHRCFSVNIAKSLITTFFRPPFRRATIGGWGGGFFYLFLKIKKSALILKKGPHSVHLLVKFSIQNVVLRVSRRKNSKTFPCGAFFSYVFNEIFIEVLFIEIPRNLPYP